MTYRDLIIPDICAKLSVVSFSTPKKNLDVFRFISSLRPLQEFFESERNKILSKYGTNEDGKYTIQGHESVTACQKELDDLADLEITDTIYCPDLSFDDFLDDLCEYPKNKQFWMNANEINALFNFLKMIKK